MRAFFDSLGDVELVTQCRYQVPTTLQEAIETAQRVKGCRLASEASSASLARRTQITSAEQEAPSAPTTSFTPRRLRPGMPRGGRGTYRPRIHACG